MFSGGGGGPPAQFHPENRSLEIPVQARNNSRVLKKTKKQS